MDVSRVEIHPIRPNQGLVGFASIELDGELLLGSIGIYTRRDGTGYRLTYPTRSKDGISFEIFHPTAPRLSREIEQAIFSKVEAMFTGF